jgi:SAM-dependent methyltransferase
MQRRRQPESRDNDAPKVRRALSHVGGAIDLESTNRLLGEALVHALSVDPDERATMAHVHGFHTYAARLHPETAARLVAGLAPLPVTVLDPFCGSGTILVEARRLGHRTLGVDANPLAVELTWLKTRGITPELATQIQATAQSVAEHADERRRTKAGPTRRYGREDLELYDVHLLFELDGLKDGISKLATGDMRRALLLVLSACLGKVSRRPQDTANEARGRRLPAGFAIRFFVAKAKDLAERLTEYTSLVPDDAPACDVRAGDAREVRHLRDASVDLVVTSPPYPGVFDYYLQHAARLRWLDLEAKGLRNRELGSRRRLNSLDFDAALEEWRRDFGQVLAALRRVLRRGGRAALVIADSAVAGRAVFADSLIGALAPSAGLDIVAHAAQPRPHFHGPSQAAFSRRPRREHVLVLERR